MAGAKQHNPGVRRTGRREAGTECEKNSGQSLIIPGEIRHRRVDEVLLLGIARHVLEWQDRNRRFVGKRERLISLD
jgi:hypothetical protein